jgi:hypothetical protein
MRQGQIRQGTASTVSQRFVRQGTAFYPESAKGNLAATSGSSGHGFSRAATSGSSGHGFSRAATSAQTKGF